MSRSTVLFVAISILMILAAVNLAAFYLCHAETSAIILANVGAGGSGLLIAAVVAREMNRLFQQQSKFDPQTHLLNRPEFFNKMDFNLQLANRYSHVYALCLIDIDKLGEINTKYGHAAGDQVIGEIAGLLINRMRKSDISCRAGGDEFGVLLPETDPTGAAAAAEKIKKMLDELEITTPKQTFSITVAVGVALSKDAPGFRAEPLIANAEAALEQAVDKGGNCIVMFKSEE